MFATLVLAASAALAQEPIRVRLRDAFTGAPVAGATCELWTEEDLVPGRMTATTLSGADGVFALSPSTRDEQKIRIRAPGYRSTVLASPDDVEVLFPQGEAIVLRIVDLDGRPIEGARVRTHQTCRHAPPAAEGVSDADGRVVLSDAPPYGTFVDYEVRASGYGALLPSSIEGLGRDPTLYLPRRAAVRVRLLDSDGTPLAKRYFRQQGPKATLVLTDGDGVAVLDSLLESREIGLTEGVKPNPIHLYGWPAPEGELTLRVGEKLADPSTSWPVLRVTGAERGSTLHVQFGDDSVTCEASRENEVRVRPGVPVVVLCQGDEIRRARLDPWEGERTLDLGEPATLVRGRELPAEPLPVAFRVQTSLGEPLPVKAKLSWWSPEPEDEDPSPDGVLFHLPEGEHYLVSFSAEGYTRLYRLGRVDRTRAEPEIVRLPRE